MLNNPSSLLLNTAAFIIQTIFSAYITLLILQLLFQMLRVDWRNPISQIIHRFTRPVVKPFQAFLPTLKRVDLAIVIVLLILTIIELLLIALFSGLSIANLHLVNYLGLIIWAFGDIAKGVLDIFFYAILAKVLISWIAPTQYSPFTVLLFQLTEPILAPARRIIPVIANLDFSPLIVLFIIKIISMLVATPLILLGTSMII